MGNRHLQAGRGDPGTAGRPSGGPGGPAHLSSGKASEGSSLSPLPVLCPDLSGRLPLFVRLRRGLPGRPPLFQAVWRWDLGTVPLLPLLGAVSDGGFHRPVYLPDR